MKQMFGNRSPRALTLLGALTLTLGSLISRSQDAPDRKGEIIVRHLGGIPIQVDGDLSDWPLEKFETVAEQPPFPQGQNSPNTNARGDHIVFDPDRIGRFNGTGEDAWQANDSDFGSTLYFAYNDQHLYLLAVCIDDILRMERDTTEFGSSGFLNDGFEFFLDTRDNSMDCASGIEFPDFDQEEPNVDDFQVTVGLNENFKPEDSNDSVLGARQAVERAGDPESIGPDKGGPGGTYQDALDAIPNPDIAALWYDDLRAAGALNPEILANPDITYTGYAIEMLIPFGCVTAFTPDHNMGFELFWRDVDEDDDPGKGGGDISWASWAQSTNVPCDDPVAGLFQTSNWGELVFDTDNPLGEGGGPVEGGSIAISLAGDKVVIEWEGTLESADNVSGPWASVEGSSPLSVPPQGEQRFYRALADDTGGESELLFSDDLESGAEGWSHKAAVTGKRDPWELGTPSGDLAPDGAASGDHAWGTNLKGGYPNDSDASLRTPPIDLSGRSTATLMFTEYLDVEGPDEDGFIFDEVKINVLSASNPEGAPLAEEVRQRATSVRGWLERKVTLPPEALGQDVIIEFRFISDGFNDPEQGGWYIDDVSVRAE